MSRASYLNELHRLRQRLDSLLEAAFAGSEYDAAPTGAPGTWSPTVDLFETVGEYILFAELPGVTKEEVDLEVRGRQLVLSGRRDAPEGGAFHRMERSYGPFLRTFELDHDVDQGAVEARLEQGLLQVRVPKKSGARVRVSTEATDG